MREIQAASVTKVVRDLFVSANYFIPSDILAALKQQQETELSQFGQMVLDQIIENDRLAAAKKMPICQDTGMAVVFVDYGQDVHVVGGSFEQAVEEGVRQAYTEGYLRKSVVSDPLFARTNTKDNTPAVIHVRIVPGENLRFLVTPKGFGSENMSALKLLTPAAGVDGVKQFVLDTVRQAGPNPCPPIIVGIGIGGTMDKVAELAKRATLRPVGSRNLDRRYADLEQELLAEINETGIGPAGLGGSTTALAVNIEWYPTHIAGLPVAVNIVCHACRRQEAVL